MKKHLILLLISILALGLLSCSPSKSKTSKEKAGQEADKQSTSSFPDTTDESKW